MNAIEDNDWTRQMLDWGRRLPHPEAILCISAHWLTDGVFVTASPEPRMIYDMYGFPPALYHVQYPARGDPFLAKRIHDRFPFIRLDSPQPRGLDHGAWSVLKFLFPHADVPVLQLSLDMTQAATFHVALGQQLAVLRDEGVMLVGSGNIAHNLQRLAPDENAAPFDWALRFDQWFATQLAADNTDALANDYNRNDDGRLSVPTPDHYFPALVIAGARMPDDTLHVEYDAIQYGSLAMRSFMFC